MQVASLKAAQDKNDYKQYYYSAQQTIKELQVQLDAFTGLSDTLRDFEISQVYYLQCIEYI